MSNFNKAELYIYTGINELSQIEFYKRLCLFSSLELRLSDRLGLSGEDVESMLYYINNREHFALSEQNIPCGNLTIPKAVSKIPDKMTFLNGGKDIAYVLGMYLHSQLCPFEGDLTAKLAENIEETRLSGKAILACFRVNVKRYGSSSSIARYGR